MKKILLIAMAALCILTCALSACKKTEPDKHSTPKVEYNDPAMDDIYG